MEGEYSISFLQPGWLTVSHDKDENRAIPWIICSHVRNVIEVCNLELHGAPRRLGLLTPVLDGWVKGDHGLCCKSGTEACFPDEIERIPLSGDPYKTRTSK